MLFLFTRRWASVSWRQLGGACECRAEHTAAALTETQLDPGLQVTNHCFFYVRYPVSFEPVIPSPGRILFLLLRRVCVCVCDPLGLVLIRRWFMLVRKSDSKLIFLIVAY